MRGKFAREWYKKGEILLNKYDQNGDSGLLFEFYIYLFMDSVNSCRQRILCLN